MLGAATEADQPGMGMTNRVIPAQGEERGASFTLIRLDGDVSRKFQPHQKLFFMIRPQRQIRQNGLNIQSNFAPNRASALEIVIAEAPNASEGWPFGSGSRDSAARTESVRLVPVASDAYVDLERNRQFGRLRHMCP